MAKKPIDNSIRHERVAGNDFWDVQAIRTSFGQPNEPVKVVVHQRALPDARAQFAMECIGRWAVVAGEIDGEDSAGRSRLRRMTPAEITAHACSCAEQAFTEFERRGWLVQVPAYQDLIGAVKNQEDAND